MLCGSGMDAASPASPCSKSSMPCGSMHPFSPMNLGGSASAGLWGALGVTGGAE